MNASKSLQLALAALLPLAGACGGDDDGPTGLATGSIEISVVTTGSALDSDGYTVSVDGMSSQSIAINGSVTFAGVAAGEHEVELSSVAPNCVVAGENPHTVTVLAGGTLSTGFNVSCALAPLSGRIAFATDRDGNLEIYIMDADGSNPVNLTNSPSDDYWPAWSPDGTRIAFSSSDIRTDITTDSKVEIYVIDADGSNPVKLTDNPPGVVDEAPAWSPDGTRIAFATNRDDNSEIYVMDADGSSPVNLTNDPAFDAKPAWSPDGTRIAFETNRDGNLEIYIMDADGSNPVNLTNNPAHDGWPAWSPDGTRIAFNDASSDIYVMDADGSNRVNLTKDHRDRGADSGPTWSPDGRRIAFRTNRDDNVEVYVMDADGSNPVNLTNDPAHDDMPAWSPE